MKDVPQTRMTVSEFCLQFVFGSKSYCKSFTTANHIYLYLHQSQFLEAPDVCEVFDLLLLVALSQSHASTINVYVRWREKKK